MPVLKSPGLVRVAVVACVALITTACGSAMVPTPTPTSAGASIPASPVASPGTGLGGQAARGEQLFAYYRCNECHSITGQRIVGPPLNGLYGSKVSLSNGQTVVADDAYLKLALLEPDAQIVNGYPSGVMSGHIQQFESEIATPDQLNALLAYLKSLK